MAGIITFTYSGRNVAIRKPLSYQDAEAQARRLYNLQDLCQYPTFGMSITLRDARVELGDADAWTLVRDKEWVEINTGVPHVCHREWEEVRTETSEQTQALLPEKPAQYAIYVKTLTQKTITIDVTTTTTVSELRPKFQDKEGIPPAYQRLIFAGNELEGAWPLTYYGIRAGSAVTLVLTLRGAKPVILFYYPKTVPTVNVSLALRECWRFSAVYPVEPIKQSSKGEIISWEIEVERDGLTRIFDPLVRYSSLFWEAETVHGSEHGEEDALHLFDPRKVVFDSSNALVFTFEALIPFLEHTLRALQLTDTAATDFMQYWMPNFTKLNERNMDHAISFLPMKHLDEVATLSIQPAPDVVFRVFLLFKGVSKATSAAWVADQKALLSTWLADVPADFQDASKQRVLEWGGMQVF